MHLFWQLMMFAAEHRKEIADTIYAALLFSAKILSTDCRFI